MASQIIGDGSRRLLRRAAHADRPQLPDLELRAEPVAIRSARSAGEAQACARARVQLNQSAAQLRALELQVATEVPTPRCRWRADLTRYQAATAARELAQKRLEAEQSRFEVGLSTNFFVVQAQRDLRDRAEHRAARAARLSAGRWWISSALQEAPAPRGGGDHDNHAPAGGGAWPGGGITVVSGNCVIREAYH